MSVAAAIARVAVPVVMAVAATKAIAAQPAPAGRPVVTAVVQQPRPFGYVVGDLVTQRVLLTTPELDFEPAALPPPQRLNVWFERRTARIEVAADGRRWLVVDHQLINAPRALTTVQLPAWRLEGGADGAQLQIPAAPLSIAPLISEDSPATAAGLRPDREVPLVETTPARRGIVVWAFALAITLAAWLAWVQWRNRRDSLDRPFARALHRMRRLDQRAPEAWQALHRAFDQTAGRVLQLETLPALFERAPHLQPRRAEIERFFAQSNQRFFGEGLQSNPPSDPVPVRELCQELRRIERRHAQ